MYETLVASLRNVSEYDSGYAKLMYDAADAIEVLSKMEKATRWIPVTERLPEKSGSYLVYVYGEVTEMDCWRGKWHMLGDDYTKAVTHWMPLPEPPKEEA